MPEIHRIIRRANALLRNCHYTQAIEMYELAKYQHPRLAHICNYNIKIAQQRLSSSRSLSNSNSLPGHNDANNWKGYSVDTLVENNIEEVVLLNTNPFSRNTHITTSIYHAATNLCNHITAKQATYSNILKKIDANKKSLLICIDGQRLCRPILERATRLASHSILWTFDDPYTLEENLSNQDLFQFICTNDKDSVSKYTTKCSYMPLATSLFWGGEIIDDQHEYKYDIFFCGSAWPNRISLLNILLKAKPDLRYKINIVYNKYTPKTPLLLNSFDYIGALSHKQFLQNARDSKITLALHRNFGGSSNNPTSSSPGPRIFETGGVGAFQLSEYVCSSFVEDSLKQGIDYFSEFNELLEKIDYYLSNDQKREFGAKQALNETLSHHTYEHRLKAIINLSSTFTNKPAGAIGQTHCKSSILLVIHNTIDSAAYGGLEIHMDLVAKAISDDFNVYILTSRVGSTGNRHIVVHDANYNLVHKSDDILPSITHGLLHHDKAEIYFASIIEKLSIDLVHIFHFINNVPGYANILKVLDIPYIVSFHDFYAACRSFNLLDSNDVYCEKSFADLNSCDECLEKKYSFPYGSQKVRREFFGKLLWDAAALIYVSKSTRDIHEKFYPFLKYHQNVLIGGAPLSVDPKRCDYTDNQCQIPKIIVLGHLTLHKGGVLLAKALEMSQDLNLNIDYFGVVDQGMKDRLTKSSNINMTFYGKYNINELDISSYDFSLHLSIWPETYCQTLSQAWAFGLTPIATNIGAFSERITHGENGWLVDWRKHNGLMEMLQQISSQPLSCKLPIPSIDNLPIITDCDLVKFYSKCYTDTLSKSTIIRSGQTDRLTPGFASSDLGIRARRTKWNALDSRESDDLYLPDDTLKGAINKLIIAPAEGLIFQSISHTRMEVSNFKTKHLIQPDIPLASNDILLIKGGSSLDGIELDFIKPVVILETNSNKKLLIMSCLEYKHNIRVGPDVFLHGASGILHLSTLLGINENKMDLRFGWIDEHLKYVFTTGLVSTINLLA